MVEKGKDVTVLKKVAAMKQNLIEQKTIRQEEVRQEGAKTRTIQHLWMKC